MATSTNFSLLDQHALAALLRVSAETLRTWRSAKKGPPFRRLMNGRVVYEEADVLQWPTEQPKYNTAP